MNENKKTLRSVRKFIEIVLNQFDVIMKMEDSQKEKVSEEIIKDFINQLKKEEIDFKKKHIVRVAITDKKIEAIDEVAVWEPMSTEIIPNIITFESSDSFIISADIPNISLYDVLTYYDEKNEDFVVYFGQMYTYRFKPHFNVDIRNVTKRRIAGKIEIIIPKLPY
ncbi:MAG: hypothetical protein ACP6IS_00400 [Candidatus Asgardarchaeia archaeon]